MTRYKSFLFVDLASQVDGAKPFDGMAAGKFIDMSGRTADFKAEKLPVYVKNTKAVLASTTDSNGEVTGLPIDAMNHDHREAAGWVVDVNMSEGRDVIEFTPRWNQVGLDLIGGDVVRFFSPSVDLANETIFGGSLTNYPATRDEKTGKILLRPVELSLGMYELSDESILDRANRIARSFRDTFGSSYEAEYAWPVDVFDNYVICELGEKLYRVDFKETADGFEFTEFSEWVEVKRSYVEAAMREFKKWISGLFKPGSNVSNGGNHSADQTKTGVFEMEMTQEQLIKIVSDTVNAALAAQKPTDPKAADLSTLLELDGLSEEAKKQRKAELKGQLEAIRKQAELEYRGEMLRLEFENRCADMSQKLVSGSDAAPRGYRVSSDDLKAHLTKMDPDEAKWWGDLLTGALEKGFVEYAELGHSRVLQGTQILPAAIAASLKQWIAAGQTLEDFFKVNAVELGVMSDYNLAEFQPKESK